MAEEVDHHVVAYMAAIAAALESVPLCKTSYGEFYVSEALISYDGDETGYAVVADEHGGYAVRIGRDTPPTATSNPAGTSEQEASS